MLCKTTILKAARYVSQTIYGTKNLSLVKIAPERISWLQIPCQI